MNEVPITLRHGRLGPDDAKTLRENFEALYRQRYGAGTTRAQAPLEIISFLAEAVTPTGKPAFAPLFAGKQPSFAAPPQRSVYMRGRGFIKATIFAYDTLAPDTPIEGPAVIERESTTIWLPPATRATLDIYGNLTIDL